MHVQGRLTALALLLAACGSSPPPPAQEPSPPRADTKCEQACRNYATLVYRQKTDADIEAAPEDQRVGMRAQREETMAAELERGLSACASQCETAKNPEQVDCMIAATTGDEATACTAQ